MAHEYIAAGSSGAHHQVDDRQRPEDVVVEPEEKDGRIFGILVVCDFALAPISPLFCHFFALALYFTLL